jgi:hypothetical protein
MSWLNLTGTHTRFDYPLVHFDKIGVAIAL